MRPQPFSHRRTGWFGISEAIRQALRRLEAMRIGVLTGGGDCPGLNAVIRAVARRAWARGHDVVGVREGWRGMLEQQFQPLRAAQISGILPRRRTIIRTSRTDPYTGGRWLH